MSHEACFDEDWCSSLKEKGICLYVLSGLEEKWALIEIHMNDSEGLLSDTNSDGAPMATQRQGRMAHLRGVEKIKKKNYLRA